MEKSEDFIRYVSVPSLKDAAMIRIVIKLWECSLETNGFEDELDPSEEAYCDEEEDDDMVHIRNFPGKDLKVLRKLSALQLPKPLHAEIVRYSMPIGEHLLSWLAPENFRSLGLRQLDHIRWTSEGTIDVPKTIKCHFDSHEENERMWVTISNACLEDLVKEVWSRLPDHVKDANSIHNQELCRKYGYDYHLMMYWICFFKDELSSLIGIIKHKYFPDIYNCDRSILENMFDLSLRTRNKLAVKYFWQKLTEAEKNKNIMKWITDLFENDEMDYYDGERKGGYLDTLFFLLGQMNDCEQQRQVLEKYGKEILEQILFNWPWQKYFSQTISTMFPFLKESVYVELMSNIIWSIRKGRMIEKLFREVWWASPSNLKACFSKSAMKITRYSVSTFHDLLDFDTITMIVNGAPEADRKKFLLKYVQTEDFICRTAPGYIGESKVDDFLRGILASESDILQCKRVMWKRIRIGNLY